MNKLEDDNEIDNFLLGAEESHGYLAGNYARDKDAVTGAVWLSELAAELKTQDETLLDYLENIYLENGYYKNYLTEIRMLGASGNEKIHRMQEMLRKNPPKSFGKYSVLESTDYQTHLPIVSETDKGAKDILVFWLKGEHNVSSIKVTIRPSGTEPKIKVYIEIGFESSASRSDLEATIINSEAVTRDIEKAVLLTLYSTIGVDFPERGFLLFWQLPLDDKLRYFEIEPQIIALKDIEDSHERRKQLDILLSFLGSNAVQKIDDAFAAKFEVPVAEYLRI